MWELGTNLGIMMILILTFVCIWIYAKACVETLRKILAFIVSIENQTVDLVSRPPSVPPPPERKKRGKTEHTVASERLPKIGTRLQEKEKTAKA
jgi:hypothetical protein